ncbi:MAG: hypothetical protein O7E52_17790 [Candidatus Poribacteria bacterium]|nr:hypothetical protein [Candidatus Poribacteria bacterium]
MSIYYHGTTQRNARKIAQVGFLPKPPSRAVWFTTSRAYAARRARHKASRGRDRPIVLRCEFQPQQLTQRLGKGRVTGKGSVIAVRAALPPTVLRSSPMLDIPSAPEDLAAWVNELLGLKPYKGASRRHPGIDRLANWVVNRLTAATGGNQISNGELLQKARQWLPEFFRDVEIDPETLRVHRKIQGFELEPEPAVAKIDPREEEAFDCLAASKPTRRIRGLKLLAELGDADLFDWCTMYFEDESQEVVIAALQTTLRCDGGDAEVIRPFAESEDKRVRAAAIAALAKHSDEEAPRWFERGLKDREACVRLQTATLLPQLNLTEHQDLFELALYDPNPEIKRLVRKITDGKGFHEMRW